MAVVDDNESAKVEDLRREWVESTRPGLVNSAVARACVHLRCPIVISASRENNKDYCAETRAELAALAFEVN